MHFALAAVVLAGVALADPITIYSTDKLTLTSCGPEVTNCPATANNPNGAYYAPPASSSSGPNSVPTYVSPNSISSSNSLPPYIAPTPPSSVPSYAAANSALPSSIPPPAYSAPPTTPTSYPQVAPSVPASSPIISVITISTCVPTVSYSTITLAPTASTPGPGSPTGAGAQSYPIPPSSPSGAGAYAYPAGSPVSSPAPAGTGIPLSGPR
jgi:hypothetical protein